MGNRASARAGVGGMAPGVAALVAGLLALASSALPWFVMRFSEAGSQPLIEDVASLQGPHGEVAALWLPVIALATLALGAAALLWRPTNPADSARVWPRIWLPALGAALTLGLALTIDRLLAGMAVFTFLMGQQEPGVTLTPLAGAPLALVAWALLLVATLALWARH